MWNDSDWPSGQHEPFRLFPVQVRRQCMRTILLCGTLLIAVSSGAAQDGASIVSLDSQKPQPPRVAPGQVVYLKLHNVKTTFDSTPQVATTIPLPINFNGLSVTLQQSGSAESIPVPLLRGADLSSCYSGPAVVIGTNNALTCGAEDFSYDLIVQIPFELKPNNPSPAPCSLPPCTLSLNDAVLTLIEKTGPGRTLRIYPVVDQVHVLDSCRDRVTTELFGGTSDYATYACFPAITHADGSWVSPTSPAKSGEALVAYAFGLGNPDTPIKTASATPAGGLPLTRPFTISFTGIPQRGSNQPDYVGLVGGNAGLYQINFRVPPVPADLPACDSQRASNLTIAIQGTSSWDQASFCVRP